MKNGINILVVDDDEDILDSLNLLLSSKGYTVFVAEDANVAKGVLKLHRVDLILLDIMLPNIDGRDFCQEIRKVSLCPIIFITALGGKDNLSKALASGGDDYVEKPFETKILLARIAAQLRRAHLYNKKTDDIPEQEEEGYKTSYFTFNPSTFMVKTADGEHRLTPTENYILKLLFDNPNKTFTYKEIYESVWENEYMQDQKTVSVFISTLRKKIERNYKEPKFIKTVYGVGFFLAING